MQKRRVVVASALGAFLASLVFFWMLTGGSLNPSDRTVIATPIAKFNEAQARSLMAGHLAVPVAALGGEAIYPDAPVGTFSGAAYGYYGITPAVLRIPVLVFFGEQYPYLAPYYFMAAFALEALFLVLILLLVRDMAFLEPPRPRWEPWAYGAFTFVALGGSMLLLLASRPLVYEEVTLWGNAFALGSYYAIVRFLGMPIVRWAVIAGSFATLSVLARVSIGIGPVIALGLVGLVAVSRRRAPRLAHTDRWRVPDLSIGMAMGALGCAAVPIVLYCAVNYAKFGTLFSIPFDHQYFIGGNLPRRNLFYSLGGQLSPKYIPVNLWSYIRPDALRFVARFPWLTFSRGVSPRLHLPLVGLVVFDGQGYTTSVLVMAPALIGLSAVGARRLFRSGIGPAYGRLRVPVVAAVVASVVTLAFDLEQPRYLADFVPLILLASSAGLTVLVAWRVTRPVRGYVAALGLATLAVIGTYTSFALTLVNQRVMSAEVRPSLRLDHVQDFLPPVDSSRTGH